MVELVINKLRKDLVHLLRDMEIARDGGYHGLDGDQLHDLILELKRIIDFVLPAPLPSPAPVPMPQPRVQQPGDVPPTPG